MEVKISCPCAWSENKRTCIASLILTRVNLLLSKSVTDKIAAIIFVESKLLHSANDLVYTKHKSALQQHTDNSFTLLIDSSILFSMLVPGPGQASFDEILLSAKSFI